MKEKYKQNFIRAGQIVGQVRAYGKSLIQPGASYKDIYEKVRAKIYELGGVPAFPPQLALNTTAAHFLVDPEEDIIFSDELIKLDVGVCVDGAVGDCAVTVDLSGKHQTIIDAAEAALLAAEKTVAVGVPIRKIGQVIEQTILSFGLQPVRNLCGHGLGFFKVHTPPLIPNYDDRSKGIIQPGMTFAIEPFATNGQGLIEEEGAAMIFSELKKKFTPSTPEAKLIMDHVQTLKGLPFAMYDLLHLNLPLSQLKNTLNNLVSAGILGGYPPLVEISSGMVAQAENSILVDPQGEILVTTRA